MLIFPEKNSSCINVLRFSLKTISMLSCLLWSFSVKADEMPALDCIVTPSVTIEVSSPVPGTLAEVTVDRSDFVKQGQVIARLNSEVERAVVELARAKAALDSEINLGVVNLEFDERKHERFDSLYVNEMTSSQDKDEVARNLALSKEKLKHSRELRKLRNLELQKAEAQLKQKNVRSPIQGVVVQRYKSISEHVEDEAIVRIAQLNPLYVEAIVPMEQFGRISNGMQAEVFFDSFNASAQRATVTVVDQMGDAASGTFGVRLELPNPDYKLPAGLKCNVKIVADPPPEQHAETPDLGEEEKAIGLNNAEIVADPPPEQRAETSGLGEKGIAGLNSEAHLPVLESNEVTSFASCASLGPFASSSKAEQLAGVLGERGVPKSLIEVVQEKSLKYILLAPMQESLEQTRLLLEYMEASGIEDVALLRRGPYKHRISLGVFGKKHSYEARLDELTQAGFEAELVELKHKINMWWVEVNQPLSDSEILALTESQPDIMANKRARPFVCRQHSEIAALK